MRGLALALWLWPALALAQPALWTATQQTVVINVGVGTNQVVPAVAATRIYVSGALLGAVAADTVQFVYGTGTNCATGQVPITGVVPIVANTPLVWGTGTGVVLIVPIVGQALCIVTTAATTGVIGFSQF